MNGIKVKLSARVYQQFRGYLLVALLVSAGRGAIAEERSNILFIMTDQQFGEVMSCAMGTQWLETPVMDSLAANGTRFTRAYVANPLCMPARNSIFTGLYPHQTGVTKNGRGDVDPDTLTCMGTYFRKAGYDTAYFGKWHLIFDEKKVDSHGFETTGQLKREAEWDVTIRAAAVDYLSGDREKPFLAVISFLNPHDICEYARGQETKNSPIGPAPPLDQCPPAPANLAPPENETDTMTQLRQGYHASRMFPVGKFTADDWRRQRWGYYRMVERVDAEIGQVLEALRKAGLEEGTVIVFSSDHGECVGAHQFNQKTVFYEESVRVPLIISRKGTTGAATSDKLVNTGIDLIPTMLDFAGVAKPTELTGLSLRPIVEGRADVEWRDQVVLQNNLSQGGLVGKLRPMAQGRLVRTDRYKYAVYDRGVHREALFDLKLDPSESKNLVNEADYAEVVEKHRRRLRDYADETNDALAVEVLANGIEAIPFVAEEKRKKK